MLTVGLALVSALGYGVADFLAGLAARRASVIRVTLMVYAAGMVTIAVILPWVHAGRPSVSAFAWGALSGIGQAGGALALIAGFRRAPFSIAGPLSAVIAAGLAVLVGVLIGEAPSPFAWTGVLLAAPAIVAVSVSARRRTVVDGCDPSFLRQTQHVGIGFGVGAGVGCAVSLIGLGESGNAAGVWPVLAVQIAALTTVGIVAAITGELHSPAHGSWSQSAASGMLGCCAAIFYLLATRAGLLAVAAVVTSLFPVVTVGLAVAVAGERLGRTRLAGLALAAISISLIALGGNT
jgi:drug/metabolite transporter (DMT)-like permease